MIESSSVWEEIYHHMRDKLGLNVVLSNPYKTRLIAGSKKIDKMDALILFDMLRGGYIVECYVPEGRTAEMRVHEVCYPDGMLYTAYGGCA